MKTCSRCGIEKPAVEFPVHKMTRDKLDSWCKACRKVWQKDWDAKHPESAAKKQKAYRERHPERVAAREKAYRANHPNEIREKNQQIRDATFKHYGGWICACCGETEPFFLSLDHIGNDGATHRKELNCSGGVTFYRRLRDKGYPVGFQVLCMNCNFGKERNGGVCPHQTSKVQRLGRESVGSSEPKSEAPLSIEGGDIVFSAG